MTGLLGSQGGEGVNDQGKSMLTGSGVSSIGTGGGSL